MVHCLYNLSLCCNIEMWQVKKGIVQKFLLTKSEHQFFENNYLQYFISILAWFVEFLLVISSFVTWQLLHVSYNEYLRELQKNRGVKLFFSVVFMVLAITVFIPLNTAPAGFVLYSWSAKTVDTFGISTLFNLENTSNYQVPHILLRRDLSAESYDSNSLKDNSTKDNLNEFESYAKLVISFFAVSSALSFMLFITALVCTYKCVWARKGCCIRKKDDRERKPKRTPLDIFRMDDDNTSTKLDLPESAYFISLFIINCGLWIGCFVVFYYGQFQNASYYEIGKFNNNSVEAFAFIVYMYSLLCTIISCFIFSKLAYSVTYRCLKLYEKFKDHQDEENIDPLLEQDDDFTDMAQATLNFFEYWFTIHWVCYTVTSFLSIALFFDILTKYIQSKFTEPPETAISFSDWELGIVGLFTVQHCFLFLYPCFKAAAVTMSREKLIKKISAFRGNRLKHEKKELYIQYLKRKKFGFRISFFCARLRFGFNVAYISIFIGLLGVLLKLSIVF